MSCIHLIALHPIPRNVGGIFVHLGHKPFYSAASLALLLFLGLPPAFFSTGARNFPV